MDSDCWEATDGAAFLNDLEMMKNHGRLPDSVAAADKIKEFAVFPENVAQIEENKDFIVAMRAKIQSQLKNITELLESPSSKDLGSFRDNSAKTVQDEKQPRPIICLVEGFLLYTEPRPEKWLPLQKSLNAEAWGPRSSSLAPRSFSEPISTLNRLADLHPIKEDKSYEHSDQITKVPMPGALRPRMTILQQRLEVMKLLNIKLFLPTSKAAAKDRRFRRTAYNDPPKGIRRPEHHWATETYFEDISWPNYEKECGFLFENGNVNIPPESSTFKYLVRDGQEMKKDRIMLAPRIDQSMQANCMWAVDVIIAEMKRVGIELKPDGCKYLVDKTDYKDRPSNWIIDHAEEARVPFSLSQLNFANSGHSRSSKLKVSGASTNALSKRWHGRRELQSVSRRLRLARSMRRRKRHLPRSLRNKCIGM